MCFSPLPIILLYFLIVPLNIKGVDLDIVPFEKNYAPLWGKENIRILEQSREVQLTLDQYSGKTRQISQVYIQLYHFEKF
jgi:hypothetical protein